MNAPLVHRGPDDGRRPRRRVARRRDRRAAPEHHRRRGRPPADLQRGRVGLGRAERRDLQPPRAAQALLAAAAHAAQRAATPRCSCTSTRSTATTLSTRSRACSRSRSRRAQRTPARRARPLRREAALLHDPRRRADVRVRADALLAGSGIELELDPVAVDEFFVLGYVGTPRCIARHVQQLPAGHVLTLGGATRVARDRAVLGAACAERLAAARGRAGSRRRDAAPARGSVRGRMLADVPLGVLLSGGLDSTLLAAIARASPTSPSRPSPSATTRERSTSSTPRARRRRARQRPPRARADVGRARRARAADAGRDRPAARRPGAGRAHASRSSRARTSRSRSAARAPTSCSAATRAIAGSRAPTGSTAACRRRCARPRRRSGSPAAGRARRRRRRPRTAVVGERHLDWVTAGRPPCARLLRRACRAVADGGRATSSATRATTAARPSLAASMRMDQRSWLQDDVLPKADRAGMLVSLELRTPVPASRAGGVRGDASRPTAPRRRRQEPAAASARGGLPSRRRRRKRAFTVPLAQWLRGPLQPCSSSTPRVRLVRRRAVSIATGARPDRRHAGDDESAGAVAAARARAVARRAAVTRATRAAADAGLPAGPGGIQYLLHGSSATPWSRGVTFADDGRRPRRCATCPRTSCGPARRAVPRGNGASSRARARDRAVAPGPRAQRPHRHGPAARRAAGRAVRAVPLREGARAPPAARAFAVLRHARRDRARRRPLDLALAAGAPAGAHPRGRARGIDLPPPRDQRRATARPPIVNVARLEDRYKGFDVLMRALPLIRSRVPDALALVGDGPARVLEASARAGATARCVSSAPSATPSATRPARRATVFAMPGRLPAAARRRGVRHRLPRGRGARDPCRRGQRRRCASTPSSTARPGCCAPEAPGRRRRALRLLRDRDLARRLGEAGYARQRQLGWDRMAREVDVILRQLIAP